MWLKEGNRAGHGRESHLTQTDLIPILTPQASCPSQFTHLTPGQREVTRGPGPPWGALPRRTSSARPAWPHSKAGVQCVGCCCAPSVTLD